MLLQCAQSLSDVVNKCPYPAPLTRPKSSKSRHPLQDIERTEMDRDSGLWTGSSDDVAEWIKDSTTAKAGSSSLRYD